MHEEWNDALEMYGADKFTSYDEKGWHGFVRMAHRHHLKIVPYVSSGYLDSRSKHWRPEWTATKNRLDEIYRRYSYMSPRSPGWRAFLLEQVDKIFLRDGVDGIYNDMGFYPYADAREPLTNEQVDAFVDEPDHYGALEDFLGQIYTGVKRHHGLVLNHFGGSSRPPIRQKFYDYLFVGDGKRAWRKYATRRSIGSPSRW